MTNNIPDNFTPLFRSSPFLDLIGPIYNKKIGKELIIGLRAGEKHCNTRGTVHGGVFSSLADIALGYNAAFSSDTPTPMVTASINIDYVGVAKLGDWIEVETKLQKVGRRLAYANCNFLVESKIVAHASAVFSVVE